MKPTYYLFIAVLVVAIAAVAGFWLISTTSQQTEATRPTTNTAINVSPTKTSPDASVVSITLYLNDYGYNASRGGPTITAYVGDLIRIFLIGNSTGPTVHDFVLDANSPSPYNIRSNRLGRGQTEVLEFVANHPGEYKYYCSVSPPFGLSHRERGQEGTIIILPR